MDRDDSRRRINFQLLPRILITLFFSILTQFAPISSSPSSLPSPLFTWSFHLPDRKRLLPSNLPLHSLINSDCFGGGSEFGKDSCRPFEFYVNSPHISLGLFLSLSLSLSFSILSLTEWTPSRTFVPNSLFFIS